MQFETKAAATGYKRSQECDFPPLRGCLRVARDTATRWDRATGEPQTIAVWTVVTK